MTRTLPTPAPPSAPRPRAGVALGIGIAALLALTAVRLFAPPETGDALTAPVRDAITLGISVVIESLPFVFLGILLSIVVQLFVPASWLGRWLPKSGFGRRAVISLFGVLLPVCECGNMPLSRGLMLRGLTVAESMTFLLAAPILNPVTIIVTYQAFGWENGILLWRIVGGFVIANLVGWLFSRHPSPGSLLTPNFEAACAHAATTRTLSERSETKGAAADGASSRLKRRFLSERSESKGAQRPGVRTAVRMFADETSAMLPALFVGSAIAGAIQIVVSRDVLVTVGQDAVLSVFALMLLAFVIAICSNVDAFFILAFGSTFLPGAIVAFLVFGPMIDIKMLALMRTTFTTRTLVVLTAVVALASAALGLGVNALA